MSKQKVITKEKTHRIIMSSLWVSSLLLHACSLLLFLEMYPHDQILLEFKGHFFLLLAVSFVVSLMIPFSIKSRKFPISLLLIHMGTLFMLGYFLGSSLAVEFLLSLVIISEIVFCSVSYSYSIPSLVLFITLQMVLQNTALVDGMVSPSPTAASKLVFLLLLASHAALISFLHFVCKQLLLSQQYSQQLEQSGKLLINANRSFQEYAYDVELTSKREERMRITREIHDLVGYSTINISMMMEEAIDHFINDNVNKLFPLILKARDQTKATHQDIRSVLAHYRVDHEEISSLVADVQLMVSKFSQVTGIEVVFQPVQSISSISKEVHSQVLRILQEAFTNAIQHGKATKVTVSLTTYRENIHLVIEDNGRGADVITEGLGLTGMRERLLMIGGSLMVVNSVGEFKLIIEIPLQEIVKTEVVS